MKKFNHFTTHDRINLQAAILKHTSLDIVAIKFGKTPSSIYRELKNNSIIKEGRKTCSHCAICKKCKKIKYIKSCPQFVPIECEKLKKFPYVCNACEMKMFCMRTKIYYNCESAIKKYKNVLSTARRTIKLVPDQLDVIDEILFDRVNTKGQGLHHIYVTNEEIKTLICERTLRRYIYRGIFRTKPHNLRRYCSFEHKKAPIPKRNIRKIERLECRTFDYFLKRIEVEGESRVFQYDSVIGKKNDKKAILTVTHVCTNFQFGILVNKDSSESVNAAFDNLKNIFGENFKDIFRINLSDNGTEFLDFYLNEDLKNEIFIYYTDPYKSYNKAECERNHEFIRYFIPKGISLDSLTQEKINEMFSHINSYVREALDDLTPYEAFKKEFGEDVIAKLQIKFIEPQNVNFNLKLL